MTGMFNLGNVLELVIDSFNNPALAQHQLVHKRNELVLHIGAEIGNERNTFIKQFLEEWGGQIAFIAEELAKQASRQARDRLTVIDIGRRQVKR